ncbi:HAD hydrolase family protein, partial [Microbacterium sp. ISL-103]|uniref:HAD family hydrolase n=1 Tax=Microbacterium sp. ISL-103 TaxID=2819156 RepID=UPI00288AF785
MSAPWLVGLDVDGTILLQDESMSPGVPEAVARLRDAGHEVTIATGRSWMATQRYVEALELTPQFVVC